MKMAQLVAYGIPAEVVALWQTEESDRLLPLQERAIKRHGLFGTGNLLIQAPTSSGKTFIGEMAAMQTALARKKAVYLAPLKALAEEKFRDFQRKYAGYGVKVICSTRDRREFDADLEDGDFSLAVVVYEKLAQLLVRRPERLWDIELIVADELELLSDPERGAMAELLLTRILQSKEPGRAKRRRIIGLSAVVGEPEKLAAWMDARLVAHDRRPVEVRHGVLHDGVFNYRTFNGGEEGEEQLAGADTESIWDSIEANVRVFAERGESCLVFVKAKEESRRGAERLAEGLHLSPVGVALDTLRALEATRSRDGLLETLSAGVAFHNADLSPEERRAVEQAFRDGEAKVVVSTTTLASGVNVPARNVFIAADKWRTSRRESVLVKTAVSQGEYENMAGRAGRYGTGQDFGRAILVASTPFEAESLWRRYVEGDRETVQPQLCNEPLENAVLQLVAAGACRTVNELQSFLERTLSGKWVWTETMTYDQLEMCIRVAVNRVVDAGMMSAGEQSRLSATPLGHAVAAKGITIGTARELERWITDHEPAVWTDADVIFAAALTEDGRAVNITLTAEECDGRQYLQKLQAVTSMDPRELTKRRRDGQSLTYIDELRAMKIAALLSHWLDEAPMNAVEDRYQTMAGQVLAAADQISWILDAAVAIAQARGSGEPFVERLRTTAACVQWGMGEAGLPLTRLRDAGLNRSAILNLVGANLHTKHNIAAASKAHLKKWVSDAQADRLVQWAGRADRTNGAAECAKTSDGLVVDDRRPGGIVLDGVPIRLQDKQFRLIRVLASAPGECVSYDQIYQALWGDGVVEPNQMHFQKRRLLGRIQQAAPRRSDLIKTIPKRGFMLDLSSDEVALVGPT